MSFCRARNCSLLPLRVEASKRLRMMRRPTSMCAGAASSSDNPRASLKALILSASSPLRGPKGQTLRVQHTCLLI